MLSHLISDTTTMDEVIRVMRAIDGALPEDDGVKWFNYLYLTVTETLRAEAAAWRDGAFLQQFDVVFARLYFDALLAWERDAAATPPAWRPLFATRYEPKLARVQFALAGMNAHINRDLPVALERLAVDEGDYPHRNGGRHRDFLYVNDILEHVEASVRPVLATGLVAHIDMALGDLDSIVAMWNVRKARDAAWTNGEVCWRLRDAPLLQRDYLARLDHMVAFAGRGLLVPRLGIAAPAIPDGRL